MGQLSEVRIWAAALCFMGAAIGAELAWEHMRAVQALGVVCGVGPSLHCAWCPSSVALVTAGLALLLVRGRRRQPGAARARRA